MDFLLSIGVPAAIMSFGIWIIQRKIDKKEAERDKKDEARKKNEIFVIKYVNASLALGEATARAVQRIPEAHCNGDMHAALDYAEKIKQEQKDFLIEQGIDAIY